MRLRTIRKIDAKAEAERVQQRNHDSRRQVWHQQLGSKDRKGCEELVNEDFGFTEEGHEQRTATGR